MTADPEPLDADATLALFAGFGLSRHQVDEDGGDNGITPGEWRAATCQEYEDAQRADPAGLHVFSALTDPDGLHGRPQTFIEWGTKDGRTPVCAGLALYSSGDRGLILSCAHLVYVTPITVPCHDGEDGETVWVDPTGRWAPPPPPAVDPAGDTAEAPY